MAKSGIPTTVEWPVVSSFLSYEFWLNISGWTLRNEASLAQRCFNCQVKRKRFLNFAQLSGRIQWDNDDDDSEDDETTNQSVSEEKSKKPKLSRTKIEKKAE